MAARLPTIRELIYAVGVKRPDQICGCCLERPLFETHVPVMPGHPSPGDLYRVCLKCDFTNP